jgi:hypothetical protein
MDNSNPETPQSFTTVRISGPAARMHGGQFQRILPFTQYTHKLGDRDDHFAREILYHKLHMRFAENGTTPCYYMPGSGVFQFEGDYILEKSDIVEFISRLQAYQQQTAPAPVPTIDLYDTDAPHITVVKPCYVVVELHVPFGLRIANGLPAIYTKDDFYSNHKYCNLCHYDTGWNASSGASSSSTNSVLFYFGVQDVSDETLQVDDQFNINLKSGQDPNANFTFVDPAIKNRGPHRIGVARKSG